jgi:hypothetical protein
MYVRTCNDCRKLFFPNENTWRCDSCQPNKIRGRCGRCNINISYGDDYAHSAPSSAATFNYICKECWERNPKYDCI